MKEKVKNKRNYATIQATPEVGEAFIKFCKGNGFKICACASRALKQFMDNQNKEISKND